MKKIFCFMLSLLLVFNSTAVYADIHGGSSGDLDVTPFPIDPDLLDENGRLKPPASLQFLDKILIAGLAGKVSPELASLLYGFINDDFLKKYDNSDNSISLENGGSTVHFHDTFVDKFNTALQDKVHYLDGYVLYVPEHSLSEFPYSNIINYLNTKYTLPSNAEELLRAKMTPGTAYFTAYPFSTSYEEYSSNVPYVYDITDSKCYIVEDSGYWRVYVLDSSDNPVISPSSDLSYYTMRRIVWDASKNDFVYKTGSSTFSGNNPCYVVPSSLQYAYGAPIRVFYSLQDLQNFLNKGRTYVPQLPSGGFKVNVKYINNTTNLPDITYNITTENKTETEIQNQYDTTINNYLSSLDDFTDGGGGNAPTPTPSGGGSGGFGDGLTPTPTPPLGDGGSDQDGDGADSWLKKIYDQLVKLSDSVSQHFEKEETFEDKLSKYLESHDKKLDGIVDAIDKLSQGKEEGEEKGCKYDYTELSDFLTKLWNDSDQKFDQMVELLKENNEYQEKMLSTLNSIKNILLAQTVMDAFKNRSSETANKAKEKFPTSVPWDIAFIVNAMDAEPKAPVFELPIKIERLNIDEKITVDISSGEWEKLAKACKYMLSLLFVLFMVNLTRKLFFSKGDD